MLSYDDKNILTTAVKQAGVRALELQQAVSTSQITKSSALDFGVQADLDSEKTLFTALEKVSFSHRIISEEAGESGTADVDYVVFIDPIDGTVNYAKGIPTFCVSLAVYTSKLEPVFSVVYAPASDELFTADGLRFFRNGELVTRRTSIGVPFINFEGSTSPVFNEYAAKITQHNIRMRMMGCGVLGLTYTAMGWGDAGLILDNKQWDVATGLHFCSCVGLEVKSFDGGQVDLLKPAFRFFIYPPAMKDEFSFLLE